MPEIINIAAYQFAALSDLPDLRKRLLAQCKASNLRGTILLSPEGINLFLAGGRSEIDALLGTLRAIPGLDGFTPKVSVSDTQPFNRMLVRIKKEIIAFGVPGIEPAKRTSPKLSPSELKHWLDDGRPVTLLDTRNDYEVKIGTFKNAMTLAIGHFRDFPAAVSRLPADMKKRPIVMFCTGGIRCEKAGPYMEREGFENIFQLDGGILKYFEECGDAHYAGECFVFDQRVGLGADLAESESTQCFNCLATLTADEQQDPRYVPNECCPHCYKTEAQRMAETIAQREAAIRTATTPLPGSVPYDNYRPLQISAKYDRLTLIETLRGIFPHLDREHWLERFGQQLILDAEYHPILPEQQVRAGERYLHRMPATREPDVNAAIRVLYEDAALVVVAKPAPLPLHPSGRYNRNTLQAILNQVYRPQQLRPVHRLDANTTGVVVFARTRHFANELQKQFLAGVVEKVYLARVQSHPPHDEFQCEAAIGSDTTSLGGRAIDEQGQAACTRFRVLQRYADGTSLVEATPITGRTNQIRVHLWYLGWPIVGEQAYLPGERLGDTQTHESCDPPLCLHALRICFDHPATKERVSYECAAPDWAEGL
jgi:RluA family pseudouridine synthase